MFTSSLAHPHRRRFLQLSGAAAALLSLPRHAAAREEATVDLITRQESPYNAEPSLEKLVKAWSTPNELMFVRSHGKKTPELDAKSHRIRIEGLVDKPLEISLEQLARMGKPVKNHISLTCAGNRRDELSQIKKISGVQWAAGAIGNPAWEGIALRDVLAAVGVKAEAKHVWFEGLDEVEHGDHPTPFGGSIPLRKITNTEVPVLLATRMNDAPLTADHGYPVRVVVPGYIGARSVKWLGKIVVSDRPSPNYFIDGTYKIVEEDTPEAMAKAEPIYENVLNSAICLPAEGAKLSAGMNTIRGYALPPGHPTRTIAKVEVSVDGGEWTAAKVENADQPYTWALWRAEIKLPSGEHTLAVRATDNRGDTQPEKPSWNAKGYLCNGWHEVTVMVTA